METIIKLRNSLVKIRNNNNDFKLIIITNENIYYDSIENIYFYKVNDIGFFMENNKSLETIEMLNNNIF